MKIKSTIAMILAVASMMMVGCGPTTVPPMGGSEDTGVTAEGKTLLTVATYEGGLGLEWLNAYAREFEKIHAETSFEEGKKGVKVSVNGSKSYAGSDLLDGSLTMDMYFTEQVSYFDHVNKGNFANITDIVREDLTEYGDTGTIESKLSTTWKNYLTTKDGNYYAIPLYDGLYGIIYDRDLFNQYGWFFGADGKIGAKEKDNLSLGADGVKSYDDGLPATFDQFNTLLTAIRAKGVTPFSYAGSASSGYTSRMLTSVWANNTGKAEMEVNYTLDGKVTLLDVEKGVVTTKEETITQDNGYLLQKQAGKYYALKFMDEVFLGNTANFKQNGKSHLDAQTDFVKGAYAEKAMVYAMHIDGIWWENEANPAFNMCETAYGVGKMDRRFAFMPFPKENESLIGKQTVISLNESFCFINSKCSNLELAKEFFKFAHTNANLSQFTAETSITRPLTYTIEKADESKLSYFGKSVMEMKENSDIIYPYSSVLKIINNPGYFNMENWSWATKVSGKNYTAPFAAMLENEISAEQYFNGLSEQFKKSTWDALS